MPTLITVRIRSVGADAVIASGVESGGHRGTFIGEQADATLGVADLVPAVVAAVIPLSMLVAFIGMNVFGISANLISLGAIDFGMIVDGAVVMMENSMRRLQHKPAGTSAEHEIRESAQPGTVYLLDHPYQEKRVLARRIVVFQVHDNVFLFAVIRYALQALGRPIHVRLPATFRWDGVDPAVVPRVAAPQSSERQRGALQGPVHLHRLQAVRRAAGMEAAARPEQRADRHLVQADQALEEGAHRAMTCSHSRASAAWKAVRLGPLRGTP